MFAIVTVELFYISSFLCDFVEDIAIYSNSDNINTLYSRLFIGILDELIQLLSFIIR